MTDYLSTLIQR